SGADKKTMQTCRQTEKILHIAVCTLPKEVRRDRKKMCWQVCLFCTLWKAEQQPVLPISLSILWQGRLGCGLSQKGADKKTVKTYRQTDRKKKQKGVCTS